MTHSKIHIHTCSSMIASNALPQYLACQYLVLFQGYFSKAGLQAYLHFYNIASSEAQIAKRPFRRKVYHEQGLLFIGGLWHWNAICGIQVVSKRMKATGHIVFPAAFRKIRAGGELWPCVVGRMGVVWGLDLLFSVVWSHILVVASMLSKRLTSFLWDRLIWFKLFSVFSECFSQHHYHFLPKFKLSSR